MKRPVAGSGFSSLLMMLSWRRLPTESRPPRMFIGARRPYHSPVGLESCVLPAAVDLPSMMRRGRTVVCLCDNGAASSIKCWIKKCEPVGSHFRIEARYAALPAAIPCVVELSTLKTRTTGSTSSKCRIISCMAGYCSRWYRSASSLLCQKLSDRTRLSSLPETRTVSSYSYLRLFWTGDARATGRSRPAAVVCHLGAVGLATNCLTTIAFGPKPSSETTVRCDGISTPEFSRGSGRCWAAVRRGATMRHHHARLGGDRCQ
jgi:hypothetical protein